MKIIIKVIVYLRFKAVSSSCGNGTVVKKFLNRLMHCVAAAQLLDSHFAINNHALTSRSNVKSHCTPISISTTAMVKSRRNLEGEETMGLWT